MPVEPARRVVARQGAESAASSDSVTLSQEGQELLELRRRIQEAPDVREELVGKLRRDIEEGRYRPSAAEIARRMIGVFRRREP